MGGRGASSGISNKGKPYGSEYTSVDTFENIKIVRYKNGSTTAPMETMTAGRVYATLDKDNDIKHISFYDENGKRYKQIDVKGPTHNNLMPHTHFGYEHDENGTSDLSDEERQIVDKILNHWSVRRKQLGL